MRGCLTENELLVFLDGQMSADETARQQEHIDRCPTCFALFTALGSADVSAASPGTSSAAATPTAAGVTAPGDLVGTQIGQYRITRQLGRGGMGVVERCFKPLDEWRRVADEVRGRALPCGHYLPEEQPELVTQERGLLGRRWVLDRLHFHPPAYCPVD